jgi:hypothetical protein
MDSLHDDRFLVFLRTDPAHAETPETNEQPVASCDSYEEARRVKHALHPSLSRECVIRFHGDSGGGD